MVKGVTSDGENFPRLVFQRALGPMVGPEIKLTSTPDFWRKPETVTSVFSCAPPTMSRVMTWVTRMASLAAEPGQALADGFELGGIGRRAGEVNFEISDGFVGVVLARGNFAEAVGDLERVGVGGLQLAVVGAGGIKAVSYT